MVTSFVEWVRLRESQVGVSPQLTGVGAAGIEDSSQSNKHTVIIYTNPEYRGADADSKEVTSRPANAALFLNQLTMWEHSKSLSDPKIAKWVNETLLPELQKNNKLKPLVVWRNKEDNKNYVIDGNHRFLAYQAANWKGKIPVIIVPDNEILVTDWTPQSGKPQPVK